MAPNGRPVATAALVLGGGVASVEDVATVPEARRQGIGAAITYAALAVAREAGYHVAVLCASPLGIGLYKRLGFREHGMCRTFEWHPSEALDGSEPDGSEIE